MKSHIENATGDGIRRCGSREEGGMKLHIANAREERMEKGSGEGGEIKTAE